MKLKTRVEGISKPGLQKILGPIIILDPFFAFSCPISCSQTYSVHSIKHLYVTIKLLKKCLITGSKHSVLEVKKLAFNMKFICLAVSPPNTANPCSSTTRSHSEHEITNY
ncbi:hypothetical protein CR513_00971, partial [Mucuna pruriens]